MLLKNEDPTIFFFKVMVGLLMKNFISQSSIVNDKIMQLHACFLDLPDL